MRHLRAWLNVAAGGGVPWPLPVQTKVDAAGEAAHSDEHADKEENEEEVEGCHDGEIQTGSTEY